MEPDDKPRRVLTERRTWRRRYAWPRRGEALGLSHVERANVKRAQLTLERRHGGRQALSDRTGIAMENLKRYASKRGKPTAALALALARLAGVSVEDVLSGAWPGAGACSQCGRGG